MSEASKSVARSTWTALNTVSLGKVMDVYVPDVVYQSTKCDLNGRDAVKRNLDVYFTAFSNIKMSVEDRIAEGDKVVSRVSGTGIHTGDLQGISPTEKQFSVSGVSTMRVANGKIAE